MGLLSYYKKNQIEAGCDEAGRGCLSGPVVAGAVILKPKFNHPLLNDSKKLTEKQRETLYPIIQENSLAFGIGIVSHIEIDQINILQASFLAMHRAINEMKEKPELLLIDGNRFKPYENIPHVCVIKGDGKYKSIAAASILAKVKRDEIMQNLHSQFPAYDWLNNKGYPTKKHREAILKFGITPFHRKTFQLLPIEQLKLNI